MEGNSNKLQSYDPLTVLGVGGFGIVFLLQSREEDRRTVALKLVCPNDAELQNAIERECKTMEATDNHHENIMKVNCHYIVEGGVAHNIIDNWSQQNEQFTAAIPPSRREIFDVRLMQLKRTGTIALCIEMEPCGPTLRDWLTGNTTNDSSLDFTLQAACDLIHGLRFLHSRKILHRDLTPENIFFSYSDRRQDFTFPIKIGDFGQSKLVAATHSVTSSQSQPFSILYRAKEACYSEHGDGALRYGMNADWYSLGLILYEIFYMVPYKELQQAFDKLVLDGMFHHNPRTINGSYETIKHIILGLTRRHSRDREEGIKLLTTTSNITDLLLPCAPYTLTAIVGERVTTTLECKCVVVGDSEAGPASLLHSYINACGHSAPVIDHYYTRVMVDGVPINLRLWSWCASGQPYDIRLGIYAGAEVYLISFSVVHPALFGNVWNCWYPEVRSFSPNTPVILVGTNVDLRGDQDTMENLRTVGLTPISYYQGLSMANKIKAVDYVECSSRTQQGVEIVFNKATRVALSRFPDAP